MGEGMEENEWNFLALNICVLEERGREDLNRFVSPDAGQ